MGSVTEIETLAVVALAALAVFVVQARRLRTLRRALQSLDSRATIAERELAAARRKLAQVEADHQSLARVVRSLPHIAHELHAGRGVRQIPKLVLDAAVQLLEPSKVLVAVRRRAAESDPDRHMRLVVAATSPEGWMPIGAEIPIGQGEIGYAADVQRVMDRREFENQPATTRRRLRAETARGCQPDIVAPMVFNEELVGVIAVEGLKHQPEAKDTLRLLAQVGAVSVHTQAKYTEMKTTASIDGLTGVFNKHYLTHRLAEEMRRALDEVTSVSVFIFDVDNFKHYNDRNGHVAGDRLLQRLATLVLENVRKDTIFGRYGGEEFLVIFPGTRRAQALAAAENVRSAIAAHEFAFGFDQPLGVVSVSGGVAECPVDGTDAATLVRAADEALYRAKRGGRNRVLAHQPTYLGGEEAQVPLLVEEEEEVQERVVLERRPSIGAQGEAVTLAAGDATPPGGTRVAAAFTPPPGTPAAGVAKPTPAAEVLAAAPKASLAVAPGSVGPPASSACDAGSDEKEGPPEGAAWDRPGA